MENNLTREIKLFYERYQGATDSRSNEEKEKDFLQTEFVAEALPVNWVVKTPNEFRSFPVLNQYYTSKCVAFTIAKLALINFWLKTKEILFFSPNSIYDYRINKPSGGMVGDDAFKIWQDKGIALEAVCKSNQVQETEPIEMTLFAKEVAKGFRLSSWITIPNGDFDRVASTIQVTGKGVMCWFYFTHREWSLEVPVVMDNLSNESDSRASRHSVTCVDGGIITLATINGKQVLKMEDSAHFGGLPVRYITREFFNARNFLIKYPMNFNYEEPTTPIPVTYQFTLTMKFGDKNEEVKELQKRLQKLGFFPTNISTDGIFGNITKSSVKRYQKSKGLIEDGIVGVKTISELNK